VSEKAFEFPTEPPVMDMAFAQWPAGVPRPSADEYASAEKRYKDSLHPEDTTDFVCGFKFVMATYNRLLWWPFFYPAQKEQCASQFLACIGV
jgi:hypothetical protein